jgi:hypothetical protein
MNEKFAPCQGPNCRYTADLCEWNFCRECCEKVHIDSTGQPAIHVSPWLAPGGSKMMKIGFYPGFKTNDYRVDAIAADADKLPAQYKEKEPPAPKPEEMEETTDSPFGDWTLLDRSSTTYCAY